MYFRKLKNSKGGGGGGVRIVVTGFEPFGGRERNLSWNVAARVASHGCPAGLVKAVMLPVSFSRVIVAVSDMLRDMRPDAVLMLGLAPKRKRISVERLAVNLQDARQPDNDGAMPVDMPVETAVNAVSAALEHIQRLPCQK